MQNNDELQKDLKDKELNQITDFLYEVGMLQHTPRKA
jgi:hypothetical protein